MCSGAAPPVWTNAIRGRNIAVENAPRDMPAKALHADQSTHVSAARREIHFQVNEQERISAARELYDRLRAIARARMAGQALDHTLDPTGLANEAILRLLKCDVGAIRNEGHFLAVAAEAMRQVLVDHARGKRTSKR